MFYNSLDGPFTLPHAVEDVIHGRPYDVIWINQVGGVTFRVNDGDASQYVKWSPTSSGIDLRAERTRLEWVRPFTPVPRVVDYGVDDDGTWLVTTAIDAESAAAPKWHQHPRVAASAMGKGLQSMHETIPLDDCPFSWSVVDRLDAIHERIERGELAHIEPRDWNEEFASLSVEEALLELHDVPDLDSVVCHGDACAPNTLLDESGAWTAHVDLGSLGVGDRWADLAIASWSTVWNYGPNWEATLYNAYGVVADEKKIRYYRLLWELG